MLVPVGWTRGGRSFGSPRWYLWPRGRRKGKEAEWLRLGLPGVSQSLPFSACAGAQAAGTCGTCLAQGPDPVFLGSPASPSPPPPPPASAFTVLPLPWEQCPFCSQGPCTLWRSWRNVSGAGGSAWWSRLSGLVAAPGCSRLESERRSALGGVAMASRLGVLTAPRLYLRHCARVGGGRRPGAVSVSW